jgi:Patatin-like phospholipase
MPQSTPPTEVKNDPFLQVFRAELEELRERREQCLPEDQRLKGDGPGDPSTKLNLVGLALSGGGIRSASFSLGVVQELARRNLLKYVDYLSTVSGGGYLGAGLSSLLADSKPETLGSRHFPLRKELGEPEPPALRNLRNGSNYLKPPGLLNAMGLPAIVLRGVLLTFIALLPLILGVVLVTEFLYEVVGPAMVFSGGPNIEEYHFFRTPLPSSVMLSAFGVLGLLFPFAMVLLRSRMNLKNRHRYLNAMAAMLLGTLILLMVWPGMAMVDLAAYLSWSEFVALLRQVNLNHLLTWGIIAGLGGLGFFAVGRRILKTLGMTLLAISGPLILLATYLALCLWQVSPPRKLELTPEGWALWQQDKKALLEQVFNLEMSTAEVTATDDTARKLFTSKRLFLTREDANSYWSDTPIEILGHTLHYSIKADPTVLIVHGTLWDWEGQLFLLLVVISLVINVRFLNINYTSPHSFYRDQLSQVFLMREQGNDVISNDAMKLSELRKVRDGGASCAPYHLINAAINLGSDTQADLRGRKAGFFLFSKHFVGSEETGWCETARMEKATPHLDLGTAMAISGAAASPNMGAFTSRSIAFLMMLLNIRLGYWLPNPAQVREPHRPFWVPGPRYLLKEALGMFDTRGRYVNVSDGGHLENLGVYELLRRRCRLIIAVDGEADPRLQFNSLVTLLRFARIDLGISIDIDLEQLRQANGQSKVHWVQATIHYGEGETGTLLYLKSTLTGDESPYVRAYHEANPAFPHESTANQFFTETQLEVYRALGEHSAEGAPLKELILDLPSAAPSQTGQAASGQTSSAAA